MQPQSQTPQKGSEAMELPRMPDPVQSKQPRAHQGMGKQHLTRLT